MKKVIEDFLECVESLNTSLNDAGGAPFSIDHLKDISALELIDLISSNNIRFEYKGKIK